MAVVTGHLVWTPEIRDWRERENRHVCVDAPFRPRPYTRLTRRGMWRSDAARYLKWRAEARDYFGLLLKDVEPLEGKLGIAFGFGAEMALDGGRRRTCVRHWDLGNLVKATEDALQGILFANDRSVRWYGPCYADDDGSSWISVHVWEGGPWREEWVGKTVMKGVTVT